MKSSLGKVFDREFARAVMKEASAMQPRIAEGDSREALRRVKLLRTGFTRTYRFGRLQNVGVSKQRGSTTSTPKLEKSSEGLF